MPNFNPAGTAQRYLFTISCVLLLFSLLVACGGGNRMKPERWLTQLLNSSRRMRLLLQARRNKLRGLDRDRISQAG
jgi:hypothetical protein